MNPFPQHSTLGQIWFDHNGTWIDAVRRWFPNATDDFCDYVLYERTAFPCCDGETVFRQIAEFAETLKTKPADRDFCDFCNELAESGKWLCSACDFVMSRVSQERGT